MRLTTAEKWDTRHAGFRTFVRFDTVHIQAQTPRQEEDGAYRSVHMAQKERVELPSVQRGALATYSTETSNRPPRQAPHDNSHRNELVRIWKQPHDSKTSICTQLVLGVFCRAVEDRHNNEQDAYKQGLNNGTLSSSKCRSTSIASTDPLLGVTTQLWNTQQMTPPRAHTLG